MKYRVLFCICFIFTIYSSFAQTDTAKQVATKIAPATDHFNVSSIINQITRHYKSEFEDNYFTKTKRDHCWILDFGEKVGEHGDSAILPIKIVYIPYVKSDYFFADFDGDGIDEIIAPVSSNDGGDSGGDMTEYFVFKLIRNKYRIVSITPDYELPADKSNKPGRRPFTIKTIKNGLIIGNSTDYAPGDTFCCPSLYFQRIYKYINNKWVFYSSRKMKRPKPKDY